MAVAGSDLRAPSTSGSHNADARTSMDPERWRTIEALYHRALERPTADRALFMESACGDDEELLDQVMSLVAQDDMSDSLLESPAWEQAPELLMSSDSQTVAGP